MSHSPRFDNGKKVWVTFSDNKPERYTVKSSHFNPLIRIYQYSFKEVEFSCGEMNLRYKKTDKPLRMGDCIHDNYSAPITEMVRLDKDKGLVLQSEIIRNHDTKQFETIFFRPDDDFIDWILEYANGRIICDVGCGSATLLNDLADKGGRVFGIEPMWSLEQQQALVKKRINAGKGIINILSKDVQDCETFLKGMGNKCLLLFCRPCHSNYVEDALDIKHPDTEALYITIPENLELYDDLGKYKEIAVKINHKGWSADKEIVYSIK